MAHQDRHVDGAVARSDHEVMKMKPMEYLETYDVIHYVNDAMIQLLKVKLAGKEPACTSGFLAEYFISVREGRHVLFREFEYIMATDHSRRSFLRWLQHCLEPLQQQGATYTIADYYNMIKLLCKDFPLSIVKSAAAMLLVEDGLECLVSVDEFMIALKIRLIYQEFLDECQLVFSHDEAKPNKGAFLRQLEPVYTDTTKEHAGHTRYIPLSVVSDALNSLDNDKQADLMDIFNCLIRSEAVRRLSR
eukprot:m.57561 g.57561  ORF g.57561 m.57561 type:complete len:247 (+) comp22405_c0_seq1:3-743(+)